MRRPIVLVSCRSRVVLSVEFVDWPLPDLSRSTRTPLCISIQDKVYIFVLINLLLNLCLNL